MTQSIRALVRLPFMFRPSPTAAEFSAALLRGEIRGLRCSTCGTVSVPPRPICSQCWARSAEWVTVADGGAVETYVVVNVPFCGQQVRIPYVLAHVLLDGASTPILHLLGTLDADGALQAPAELRTGMRVRASWRSTAERIGSLNDDVDHFEPE